MSDELPAHRFIVVGADSLTCGFDGRLIHFEHRQYEDRSADQRADYDRLRDDLLSNGMRNSLITFKGHVLIGMRRFEILRSHVEYFECIEIIEDVSEWWNDGPPKLEALKRRYYA